MTYPDPVYFGDGGETTAWSRSAHQEADFVYPNGNTIHYLATGESTGGLFGMYRWVMGPKPSGSGPHFHRTISESFYILEGTVRIFEGADGSTPDQATSFTYPRAGSTGSATNRASQLQCFSISLRAHPGKAYFEGLVGLADMSEEERSAFASRHDNTWLEP